MRQLVLLLGLTTLTLACGRLLDADHFRVAQPRFECGPLEVLTGSACRAVGVSECGAGFLPNEEGGCEPIVAEEPCDHGFARLGRQACVPLELVDCPPEGFPEPPISVGRRVYVNPEAGATADGSVEQPYGSISEALASEEGEISVFLSPGTYAENVVISRRRIAIIGACEARSAIVGDEKDPTITIGPGADGTLIDLLAVSGGSTGIAVAGSRDVRIAESAVRNTEGPGIVFSQPDFPEGLLETSGSISNCLVAGARGEGIAAYGVDLHVENTQVMGTLERESEGPAIGVAVRASHRFPAEHLEKRRPSNVTLSQSIVEGCQRSCVLSDASFLSIEDSLIRDVQPDRAGRGRGIEVRAQPAYRVGGQLELRRSLVESAQDVGIYLWNAAAEVEDSVVRDVRPAPAERCLGNGIRARYDLIRDVEAGMGVTLRHSLVESTEQAAISVEGGQARIEDSIVRGTRRDSCRDRFGYGLSMHASATGPPSVSVLRSRLEKNQGAGSAVYDGDLSLEDSVLDCNGANVLRADPNVSTAGTFCECEGDNQPCVSGTAEQPSPLYGGGECDENDDTVCVKICINGIQGREDVRDGTLWSYDHDDVESVLTDLEGCAQLEGLPKGAPFELGIAAEGHAWALGFYGPLERDANTSVRAEIVPLDAVYAGGTDTASLKTAPVSLIHVCQSPWQLDTERNAREVCVGYPKIEEKPAIGVAVDGGGSNVLTQYPVETADVRLIGLKAGPHTLTLEPPEGRIMECQAQSWGWPSEHAEEPNSFEVLAEESFMLFALEAVCELRD